MLHALSPDFLHEAYLVTALLASGLFAGFVAGMFGIGGGFVVVPALAAVFAVFAHDSQAYAMHVAIGTSLATIIFTSLRSVQAHAKRSTVDFGILKGWAIWVIFGVILGVALTGYLDSSSLKIAFGVGVFVMGLHFLFRIFGQGVNEERELPGGFARAAIGATLGAVCSILGIGGGTPAVLIMTSNGVNMHRAVATAAGFGTIIAIPGAIGNLVIGLGKAPLPFGSIGFINVIALVAITSMSILTAPLGVAAAHKLNADKLRRAFGIYLLFTAWLMLHDTPQIHGLGHWLSREVTAVQTFLQPA